MESEWNQANAANPKPIDVDDIPEDVRAELDADERRSEPQNLPPLSVEPLPEDVLAELDRETRLGDEEGVLGSA